LLTPTKIPLSTSTSAAPSVPVSFAILGTGPFCFDMPQPVHPACHRLGALRVSLPQRKGRGFSVVLGVPSLAALDRAAHASRAAIARLDGETADSPSSRDGKPLLRQESRPLHRLANQRLAGLRSFVDDLVEACEVL
jgi:hypothetical protein